jgi:RNA polymerase sigma-70 factor (ECF subfamily)
VNEAADGTAAPSQPSKLQEGSASGDDRAVVARVRAGDAEAYAELVDRYGDRLYSMLLHLAGGDAEQATEFVQEAFVRAYERLDRFAGDSSFYTWIYRLARNRAIDLLAKKRPLAVERPGLEAAADAGGSRSGSGPQRALERAELRDQVQAGLARLPAEQREIILLRDFDGHDYAAIAELLEVAVGTVKSRLNRARAALRAELCDPSTGVGP